MRSRDFHREGDSTSSDSSSVNVIGRVARRPPIEILALGIKIAPSNFISVISGR